MQENTHTRDVKDARLARTSVLLSLFLVGIDGVLKWHAITYLPEGGYLHPIIDYALHKNPGIAFDIPIPLEIVAILTVLICAMLLSYAKKHYAASPLLSASALVVFIGALGNLADRLLNGFTTDYIILLRTSAINIADILILLGTIALLWYSKDRPVKHI